MFSEHNVSLIALISHYENEIIFYSQLPFYHHLNIHQVFYESCKYGYILGFMVSESDADELLRNLQQKSGVESGICSESWPGIYDLSFAITRITSILPEKH